MLYSIITQKDENPKKKVSLVMLTVDLQAGLKDLSHWVLKQDLKAEYLERSFVFENFKEAWRFMNAVAIHAETLQHHPDWSNVYNRVCIRLSTHDTGGVSEKDLQLARVIDTVANELSQGL